VRYAEISPGPALGAAVECLWLLETDSPNPEPVLPDGRIELIIHLEGRVRASDGGPMRLQPQALIAGQLTGPRWLQPQGRVRALGVRFRPGGAAAAMRVPLHELTGREAPLDDIFGAAGGRLTDRVMNAGCDAARKAAVEEFLLPRIERRRPSPIDGPLAAILRRRGNLRVGELRRFGLGERQLLRRFRDEVGLGPKSLCRALRLQAALTARSGGSWTDAALEAGFSDQAHLARDLRALAGASATQLERAGPLTRAFHFPG
jgi:AraC-like DNA-binding protein